jgi:histidine ammonia-lyase
MAMSSEPVPIGAAAELDPAAVVRIARHHAGVVLGDGLLAAVGLTRERMLAALASGPPVYGVSTGMGALSEHRLTEDAQAGHQQSLLLARAAGGAPWLGHDEVRAALAVRLRTFLNGDSGVSIELCRQIVALLDADVLPAVPRHGHGAAGEIIALAHLAAPLTGEGQVLDAAGSAVPAGPVLRAAGFEPYRLGPKEGIALIEGVPVTTALAILRAADVRTSLIDAGLVLAAELALIHASRDSLDPALARGDDVLAFVTAELRGLTGTETSPRALQPPVSFRVAAPVLAHLHRAVRQLDLAVVRALDGVTDSPAFLGGDDDGRFIGTAGFSGYDLAAYLHLVTVAVVGVAEVGAARLHRLMDPKVSGLPAQLSAEPGPHTGISPVHKRAAGMVHAMRRSTLPSTVGTVETSAGQEDVQSFSLEAAGACSDALVGLRDVVACEQLAVHQMVVLGARLPEDAGPGVVTLVEAMAALLPSTPYDRPWGLDLALLLAGPGRP